jgi:proteasome lid subunit RPN8/RPN11
MTESCSEGLLGIWAPPECPFKIAYSFRALDDIRLAVTDAFFSLPRGGAEIGGILLGKRDSQQVTILDYVALECEHAFGPSFALSPRDLAHLSVLLEEARKNGPDLQPVGWYHSHTRSEIFLSEADLEIHKRYFAAPWQVALVLKPHTFHPTRGGFFFRDVQGNFRVEASYREFVLEPMAMRPVPDGTVPSNGVYLGPPDSAPTVGEASEPLSQPSFQSQAELDFTATAETPEPAQSVSPVQLPDPQVQTSAEETPIHFPDLDNRPRWRITALLALATCLAIGAFGFETRQAWLPRIWHGSPAAAAQATVGPPLGLTLTDQDGQLQIRWDCKSPAVQAATRGTLEISSGGGIPNAVRLDTVQLQSAAFTYKREAEKVDVLLSVEGPSGELGRESAVFLGKLPERSGVVADPAAAKERDELAVEVDRLKGDLKAQVARYQQLLKSTDQRGDIAAEVEHLRSQLNAQIAHSKELEKALKPKDDQIAKLRNDLSVQLSHNKVLAQALDEAEAQLLLQRQKRLSNQIPDTAKRQ